MAAPVTLADATSTLDQRLLQACWAEIRPVFLELQELQRRIRYLRSIGVDCRHGGVGLSAAQAARISKLCDLIEALPELSFPFAISAEQDSLRSSLPDLESITSYTLKVKSKVKLVEEMAASKKNESIRFKSQSKEHLGMYDLSMILVIARQLQSTIEMIEQLCEAHHTSLSYFLWLKQTLYRTQQEIVSATTSLGSHKRLEEELRREVHKLEVLNQQYNEARSSEVLVRIALARREMITIEERVRELWRPVQSSPQLLDALSTMEQRDWVAALQEDVRILFLSEDSISAHAMELLVDAQQRDGETLDAELIRCYWLDWKEREEQIDECIRSDACQAAYSALKEARWKQHHAQKSVSQLAQLVSNAVEKEARVAEKAHAWAQAFQQVMQSEFHGALGVPQT